MRFKTAWKILKRKNWPKIFIKYIYAKITSKPIALMVEPTDLCNLNCTVCHFRNIQLKRAQHYLDFETFKGLIDEVKNYVIYINFWMAGEPLLNKDIFRMIEYANENNIVTCMSTNAMLLTSEVGKQLDEAKLDKLIVSFDGASAKTYEKIRVNAKFETVINNVRDYAQNHYSILSLQMIATIDNEHEIEQFKQYADEFKADEAYLKSLFINQGVSEEFKAKLQAILPSDQYRRSKKKHCTAEYRSVVLSDGVIVPCCFAAKNEIEFGNIKETPFTKIWNSVRYVEFRKNTNRFTTSELCSKCGCEKNYASKVVT